METPAATPGALRQRVIQRVWTLVRAWLWLGVVAAALLIAIFAESRAQLGGEEALVNTAQKTLADALRAGDKSAVRKLLSLQFTFVDENGKALARKEFLTDLKSLAANEAPSDIKVKVYGLVAMVTGSRKSAAGDPVFFLDIWAKQKGSWRALTMQNVVLGTNDADKVALGTAAADKSMPDVPGDGAARSLLAKVLDCKNPCETIPYRVRSPAEQEIVTAFQSIERATFAHDANEWAKHIAPEFMHYRSDASPQSRADRIDVIENQKEHNIPAILTGIQSMRLSVYGDGAAMISANGIPGDTEPLLRIARVWVKRNGQWQLVISVQTQVAASKS